MSASGSNSHTHLMRELSTIYVGQVPMEDEYSTMSVADATNNNRNSGGYESVVFVSNNLGEIFWAFGKYLILIHKTPPEILWSCMAFTMHVLVMFVQKLRYITINFIITQSIVN